MQNFINSFKNHKINFSNILAVASGNDTTLTATEDSPTLSPFVDVSTRLFLVCHREMILPVGSNGVCYGAMGASLSSMGETYCAQSIAKSSIWCKQSAAKFKKWKE